MRKALQRASALPPLAMFLLGLLCAVILTGLPQPALQASAPTDTDGWSIVGGGDGEPLWLIKDNTIKPAVANGRQAVRALVRREHQGARNELVVAVAHEHCRQRAGDLLQMDAEGQWRGVMFSAADATGGRTQVAAMLAEVLCRRGLWGKP